MKTIFSAFLICAVILFIGCGTSKNSDSGSFGDSEWVMFEMDGNKYEPATGKNITLEFKSNGRKVSGKAPCNTYSTTYTQKDNKLSFGQILSTEMACGELETESAYLKLLSTTFAYQTYSDMLYLFNSDGMVIFRFKSK
ncbi:MAG: META domain-containing protein [Ignavibacteria bacterium]